MKPYKITLRGQALPGPVATIYRRGAIVSGWPSLGGGGATRGIVRDASRESLRRLSWTLENSPADWFAMVTLTFRQPHPNPKRCLRDWFGLMPFSSTYHYDYAWFMEFQSRGVVHFHVFLGRDCFTNTWFAGRYTLDPLTRNRKPVTIIRGEANQWIVDRWISVVGDTSPGFLAFQEGGIIETLRTKDGAARYAGTYAGKQEQKELPADQEPLGRWWFVSRHARPVPCSTQPVMHWPWERPMKYVFDASQLDLR